MIVAILSDTHNHHANWHTALDICRQREVAHLIHCGDLTQVEMTAVLRGWQVTYAFGNVDRHPEGIRQALLNLDPTNQVDYLTRLELQGWNFAVIHGQYEDILDELAHSGQFTCVLHGHTHRRRDITRGNTRLICPGALGGVRYETRSFCLLDLNTGATEFVTLPD